MYRIGLLFLVLIAAGVAAAQEPPVPGRECVSAPPMQLVVGQQAIVQDSSNNAPLNLRDEPSTYGAKIGEVARRTVVTVVDGPLCGRANNLFAWWKIETEDGLTGWVAEGDSSRTQDKYFLAPLESSNIDPDGVNCTAAPISMVAIGSFAAVSESAGADLMLRDEPSGRIIDFLDFGTLMTVIDGPRCGTTIQRLFKWWKVTTEDGLTGWIAEGDSTQNPARYFIRLATPQEVETADLRTPVDPGCPASPPTILQAGDIATVNRSGGLPINLRSTPGGLRMAELNAGTRLEILDGPRCANQYAWWEVRAENGLRGWVAEGDNTQTPIAYFISLAADPPAEATPTAQASPVALPTAGSALPPAAANDSDCVAAPPSRVAVGSAAVVSNSATSIPLRLGPSVVADKLVDLPAGMPMVILNGPRCGDGTRLYVWWQVRTGDGTLGWVQEGDAAQNPPLYYIEPVQ